MNFSDLNKICNRLRQKLPLYKKICFEGIIAWWEVGYNRILYNSAVPVYIVCIWKMG